MYEQDEPASRIIYQDPKDKPFKNGPNKLRLACDEFDLGRKPEETPFIFFKFMTVRHWTTKSLKIFR